MDVAAVRAGFVIPGVTTSLIVQMHTTIAAGLGVVRKAALNTTVTQAHYRRTFYRGKVRRCRINAAWG